MFCEIAMYVLSALILALGGVSLFTQKVRKVDKETGEETIIELPFFGKLRTNYPALAFAFIGAGMAVFTLEKTVKSTNQWVITGEFTAPESRAIDWTNGALILSPSKLTPSINPDGTFRIQGLIQRGLKFEDVVKQISYCNWCGDLYSGSIHTEKEYEDYMNEKNSILKEVRDLERIYRPVTVRMTPKSEE